MPPQRFWLRVIGGPGVVQTYIRSLGIRDFQMQDGERALGTDNTAQYRNWISPAAAVRLLERFASGHTLSPAATAFLLQTMIHTTTGPDRIRGKLPPSIVVAHKTGSSGTEAGLTPATNDIGIITLPDGRKLFLAVFVSGSRADLPTRDLVIAQIARTAFEEALRTR